MEFFTSMTLFVVVIEKIYMYILRSSGILHVVTIADGFLVGGTVTMSTQIIIIG